MSFLRANQPVATPVYTGLQIQTASSALPIPILWGVNKIAPNIIWNGNFHSTGGGGKGGKGGGLGKGSTAEATYYTSGILALCEGPVGSISAVWDNTTISALGSVASFDSPTFFNGATPQAAWGYVPADQQLGYNGLAYVAVYQINIGSSAALDSYGFEIQGVLKGTSFNGYDADPALVIEDFLTNAQYGVGFPPASIDAATLLGSSGDASYQSYCKAAGLALSPALTDQEAANSTLARWLQLTNTAALWSGGLLKFIPYGDAEITGPLYSVSGGYLVTYSTDTATTQSSATTHALTQTGTCGFSPSLTPIYTLADDDYVYDDGKDPVNVVRSDPYAASNMQYLEISERDHFYDATPVPVFDQNAIELYGLRIGATITAHEICDQAIAQTAAQLILQRGLYIRNTYQFKLSWEYCLLEPMDLVALSDANLGLDNVTVRLIEIEEDEDGMLSLTAEEFPAGVATAVAYPVQQATGGGLATNAGPEPINTPIIFEPPSSLADGTPQIWAAVSGGSGGGADPNWGGAAVWASLDNATYTRIGNVIGPAKQGILTAALPAPASANPDSSDTLAVNMAESAGVLMSTAAAAAARGLNLAIVDSELMTFETATLSGAHAYSLTTLYRGLYGSTGAAHTSAAAFALLDDSIFKYDLPSDYIGQTFYIKFQSFNVFGGGAQDLSDCTAYSYTPIGSGSFGPVAQALAAGSNVDCGLASGTESETDDFGLASDPYPAFIDLGLASS